jgi:hypothetical protein
MIISRDVALRRGVFLVLVRFLFKLWVRGFVWNVRFFVGKGPWVGRGAGLPERGYIEGGVRGLLN